MTAVMLVEMKSCNPPRQFGCWAFGEPYCLVCIMRFCLSAREGQQGGLTGLTDRADRHGRRAAGPQGRRAEGESGANDYLSWPFLGITRLLPLVRYHVDARMQGKSKVGCLERGIIYTSRHCGFDIVFAVIAFQCWQMSTSTALFFANIDAPRSVTNDFLVSHGKTHTQV
jgi:hypothetical protein